MFRTLMIALFVVAFATPAAVQANPPGTPLFGHKSSKPKGIPIYPIRDAKYIKQYTGPVISCTNCFGYYRTQWRRWEEACGEPLPENPGPQQYPAAPVTAEPEKKADEKKDEDKKDGDKKDDASEKKDADKKDADKKDTEKKDEPKKGGDIKDKGGVNIPAPKPLPAITVPKIEINVPKLEVPMPMPVSRSTSPTVVVPIPSK